MWDSFVDETLLFCHSNISYGAFLVCNTACLFFLKYFENEFLYIFSNYKPVSTLESEWLKGNIPKQYGIAIHMSASDF